MEIRDPAIFLDYLASVHKRTRRVIDLIPPNDIEWSPVPGKFSFGDLVHHLAGIERFIYAETVHGPTPAGTPVTTYKWLRAMIEHEAHHRGQIYLT